MKKSIILFAFLISLVGCMENNKPFSSRTEFEADTSCFDYSHLLPTIEEAMTVSYNGENVPLYELPFETDSLGNEGFLKVDNETEVNYQLHISSFSEEILEMDLFEKIELFPRNVRRVLHSSRNYNYEKRDNSTVYESLFSVEYRVSSFSGYNNIRILFNSNMSKIYYISIEDFQIYAFRPEPHGEEYLWKKNPELKFSEENSRKANESEIKEIRNLVKEIVSS